MAQRVFVTGGSGFVGLAVLDELAKRQFEVNALVRDGKSPATNPAVRPISGDLLDGEALDRGMKDCQAVIHLVGIIMEKPSRGITFQRIHVEGTRAVVDAAARNGVKRYIHMSALGAREGAASEYHRTKYAAEQCVRASALEWTILRPSLIHGPKGEFMRQEAMWARRRAPAPLFWMPVMPYFGAGLFGQNGAGRLQPVFVEDVARAFVDCLQNRKTIGEVYSLGGSEQVTWPQLHEAVATRVVKKRRLVLPIPVWAGKLYAAVGIAPLLGFNRDQVIMSQEDNTCDLTKLIADFGWEPQGFSQTLDRYAADL
jgi:nucleoside-diphosphate-sugar epimerase